MYIYICIYICVYIYIHIGRGRDIKIDKAQGSRVLGREPRR